MANFDDQDLDKNALMLQLGAKKGAGAEGSPFGGAMNAMRGDGAPTSNTMPIRDRAPINDQVAAAPSPLPTPPSSPSAATGLSGLPDLAGAMRLPGGSVAQAMQTPASTGPVTPMSLTPQRETGTPTSGDQQAPDLGSSIGALAGMFKQPPPLPMEAPRPLQPLPEGAASALQPRRMPMRPQGRNPLSALAGLFSRRR